MAQKIIKDLNAREWVIDGDVLVSGPGGMTNLKKKIGIGGITSFDQPFKEEKIVAINGMVSSVSIKVGDITDAYILLKRKLEKAANPDEIAEIFNAVFETVNEYFGTFENVKERLSYYKDEDDITKEEDFPKLSDIKGKNCAICVERTALAHNLMHMLGIKSTFKQSICKTNDKVEGHAYNLAEKDGKYYLLDMTMPTMKDGKVSPLIGEIDEETFLRMTNPLPFTNGDEIGCRLDVSHFNPLSKKTVNVSYSVNSPTTGNVIETEFLPE
jgi:hypothetical protein